MVGGWTKDDGTEPWSRRDVEVDMGGKGILLDTRKVGPVGRESRPARRLDDVGGARWLSGGFSGRPGHPSSIWAPRALFETFALPRLRRFREAFL